MGNIDTTMHDLFGGWVEDPCPSCEIGWCNVSQNGSECCYDSCERLKEYHNNKEPWKALSGK